MCSLGSLCHCSQLLKRIDKNECSYPFDWIYASTPTVIHCIQDDFRTFLDKSNYGIL